MTGLTLALGAGLAAESRGVTSDYRPDIDGMRAIAVLLVIFYHAGFALVSGGFLGVDIFFVISGYLITGIVARELASGDFSFRRFYTRRIKRLLPAFYTALSATALVACFVLLPGELEGFAESALASLFFVSNFYFGGVTEGYFAPEVDSLPLLHTWSLAVEEQFYFIWPASLLLLRRVFQTGSRRLFALLGGLALVSFLGAEVAVRLQSDTVYYALWSRAGELLLGALLALHHLERDAETCADPGAEPSAPRATLATLLGLGLIAAPAMLLDDGSRFPGFNALWPCLGVAILIHIGRWPGALSRRLLSLSPLVVTGLLSYALYLWHWPIFVFARALRIEFTPATVWALIGLAYALSALSWRFIEQPIRYRRGIDFRAALLRIFAAPAVALSALCLFAIGTRGIESRFSPEIRRSLAITQVGGASTRGVCVHLEAAALPPEADCLLGAGPAHGAAQNGPHALLWGDSIANHYTGFFDELGRASGITLRDVTMAGCPPILDTLRLERKKGALCRRRNDEVLALIRRGGFETVYIAGNWPFYLEPGGRLGDDVDMSLSRENSLRVVETGLLRTVAAVVDAGKTPVILRNVPRMDFDAANCAIKNEIYPERWHKRCEMDRARHQQRIDPIDAILGELQAAFPQLRILSPLDLVCPDQTCVAELAGVPLYTDTYHLNVEGSRALGRAFLARYGPLN